MILFSVLFFVTLFEYLGCQKTGKMTSCLNDEERQICISDEIVIKPKLDDRDYRFMKLQNRLSLLTISHIGTETSAASLRVQVGSFHNPVDCLGLAHFLEHMIFMGTKKFPDERDFIDFIQNNFGSRNGGTEGESTSYYFDIPSSKFESALDRFSQFFIEPLLLEDAIEREMNAVHSEYEKNVPNDSWRVLQILREISSPSRHPVTKFSTGNLETLNQTNIRERLVDFFKEKYSSNVMYLVLYGNQTTEVLQSWGEKYFSGIKNLELPKPFYEGSFFHPPTMNQKMIQVVPVKEQRKLSLCFPVDNLVYESYRNHSYRLISHLFQHKSDESLYDILKQNGWVTSLSSGMDMRWEGQGFWSVDFSLTILGEDHIDDIIKSVFEYIQFLKTSLPKNDTIRLFEELQQLSQIKFDFKEETRPGNICKALSKRMMTVRPEDILRGLYYPYSFEYSIFQEDIGHIFNVEQFFCIWMSRIHETENEHNEQEDTNVKSWKTEKYLFGKYRTDNLSKKLIENLHEILSLSVNTFEIPQKNEFIPQNLDLVEFSDDSEKEKNLYPNIIYENDFIQLFFKQDTQFDRPKSSIMIRIYFPLISQSSKSLILANIFSKLVGDILTNTTHYASISGLSSSFTLVGTDDSGYDLFVVGWSDTVFKLLHLILHTTTHFFNIFSLDDENNNNEKEYLKERFGIIKEETVRKYGNFKLMNLYSYAVYVSRYSLFSSPEVFFYDECFNVSKEVTFKDLEDFYYHVISNFTASRFTIFAMGNHKQDEILKKISEELDGITETGSSSSSHDDDDEEDQLLLLINKTRIFKLGKNKRYILSIPSLNPNDTTNNCIVMKFQVGTRSQKLDMICSILGAIMSPIVFDALRTKEQLGYIVSFRFLLVHNVYYGEFVIQSSKNPAILSEKVRSFVESNLFREEVEEKLFGSSQEENKLFFEEQKELLRQKYAEKPKTIFEETSLAWKEISSKQFRFNRYEEYAKKLLGAEEEGGGDQEYISATDVFEFFESTFLGDQKSVFEVRLFSEENWKLYKEGKIDDDEKQGESIVCSENVEFLRSEVNLDSYPNFVKY